MSFFLFKKFRYFSVLATKPKNEESKASAQIILDLLQKKQDNELTQFLKTQPYLNLISISMILNQLRKTKNQNVSSYFLEKLESIDFDELRPISSLVSLSKHFKYSKSLSLKFVEKLKSSTIPLTGREISDIIIGLSHLSLTTAEIISLIEFYHDQMIEMNKFLSPIDRASILVGISKYLSPKIINIAKLLISSADMTNTQEISALCNYLSYNPISEFMHVFDTTERILLENRLAYKEKVLTQLLHSFSKANKGSAELFELFANDFFHN